MLDYTLARHKIVDLEIAGMYQPIIYLDTDIIRDAPLEALMQVVTLSPDLQVTTEFLLRSENDHYGQSLFEADGMGFVPDQVGFSSGTFAFRDIREQRRLFHVIVDAALRHAEMVGRRDVFDCSDQAFFDYVPHKTRTGNVALLRKAVQLHTTYLPKLTAPIGKGLVHFAAGVGRAMPKLDHMSAYIETLRRARVDRAGAVVESSGGA